MSIEELLSILNQRLLELGKPRIDLERLLVTIAVLQLHGYIKIMNGDIQSVENR